MRGKTVLIMVVLFILFSIIGLAILLFYFDIDIFSPEEELEEQLNYSSMNLKSLDKDNKPIQSEYMLYENGHVVAEGTLSPERLEIFNEVKDNTTYSLYTWSNNYYMTMSKCESGIPDCITHNIRQGDLILELEKKADRLYILKVTPDNGTINKLTVCAAWTSNILYITTPLQKINVPIELKKKYDECYIESEVLTTRKEYEIVVYFFNQITDDSIKLLVMDKPTFLDDGNTPQESYFYNGKDLGAENKEITIDFAMG